MCGVALAILGQLIYYIDEYLYNGMKGRESMDYEGLSKTLKAISDPKRMQIVDLLSCGTLCACDLLTHFEFTQPTLSHHMKVLEQAGVVAVTKQGQWHYYTLQPTFVTGFKAAMIDLVTNTGADCACQSAHQCQCDGTKQTEV